MHGDRDNPNREFACQSDPRSDCVLPASGAQNQVFSDVYVYYHGAGTKYVGSVRIGFFEGPPSGHEMKTDITVKPKESIANQSVTGIVTNTPGTYTMSFRLAATTSTGASEPVTAEVPVVVR